VTRGDHPDADMIAPLDPAALLVDFLRERDQTCPRCGYNLRNLTTPVCPECEEPLVLAVKAEHLNLIPYVVTLAPGIFSGLLLVLFFLVKILADGSLDGMPFGACMFFLFLGLSGLASALLVVHGRRFLRLRPERQGGLALVTWLVHIAVFAAMIVWMFSW